MATASDRDACGFCDGTGLWIDPDGGPSAADPCPLCDGVGTLPRALPPADDQPADVSAFQRLVGVLPRLSQVERQRLYEELHSRYDCRIYR